MQFYQIRYWVRDKYLYNSINDEEIRGACRIIGAKDEPTALQIAENDLEDEGRLSIWRVNTVQDRISMRMEEEH